MRRFNGTAFVAGKVCDTHTKIVTGKKPHQRRKATTYLLWHGKVIATNTTNYSAAQSSEQEILDNQKRGVVAGVGLQHLRLPS